MKEYLCARCGHDFDFHNDYVLEKGCRCGSCVEATPQPCNYGHDPEYPNESPPCNCPKFIPPEE